ncbi:MAG TPA: hypothetical protein VF697_17335, partial [Archangium sp.]
MSGAGLPGNPSRPASTPSTRASKRCSSPAAFSTAAPLRLACHHRRDRTTAADAGGAGEAMA